LALFGSSQSASFECKYKISAWGTIGTIYWCDVQNAVNITSLDAAQVDGTHQAGYNNDNVEALNLNCKGQLHYFPRGFNKFFKNLKAISIYNCSQKEIHKSDLKEFPKLMNFHMPYNNLEILEENLFEFNPKLEAIDLDYNKISHINPNVFDKLTNLRNFHLESNTCINMGASNNPTAVQNVIKAAKTQCMNSEYSDLTQKIQSLQNESKNLNLEIFKEKLKNLENEIKNSKFTNFFQNKLQDFNAVLMEKARNEDKFST